MLDNGTVLRTRGTQKSISTTAVSHVSSRKLAVRVLYTLPAIVVPFSLTSGEGIGMKSDDDDDDDRWRANVFRYYRYGVSPSESCTDILLLRYGERDEAYIIAVGTLASIP